MPSWTTIMVDELAFFAYETADYKEFYIQSGDDIFSRIRFFIDKRNGRTQDAIFLHAPPETKGSVLADADTAEFLESKLQKGLA